MLKEQQIYGYTGYLEHISSLKTKNVLHFFQKTLFLYFRVNAGQTQNKNLVNNLVEGIHEINFQEGNIDKESEICGIKYKD